MQSVLGHRHGAIEHPEAAGIEPGQQAPHQGGLPGAGLAGDQGQAAALHSLFQAQPALLEALGAEQRMRLDLR